MSHAARLLRIDAAMELALGLPLATGSVTGLTRRLDLPAPASERRVALAGTGLLPFAGVLWWAARRPSSGVVVSVAAINLATALSLGSWVVAQRERMNGAALALIAATAAGLIGLAGTEAAAAAGHN